jgi:hypothetical protein
MLLVLARVEIAVQDDVRGLVQSTTGRAAGSRRVSVAMMRRTWSVKPSQVAARGSSRSVHPSAGEPAGELVEGARWAVPGGQPVPTGRATTASGEMRWSEPAEPHGARGASRTANQRLSRRSTLLRRKP